jgi:hypothetical protein
MFLRIDVYYPPSSVGAETKAHHELFHLMPRANIIPHLMQDEWVPHTLRWYKSFKCPAESFEPLKPISKKMNQALALK